MIVILFSVVGFLVGILVGISINDEGIIKEGLSMIRETSDFGFNVIVKFLFVTIQLLTFIVDLIRGIGVYGMLMHVVTILTFFIIITSFKYLFDLVIPSKK